MPSRPIFSLFEVLITYSNQILAFNAIIIYSGLFYESQDQTILAEMAFLEAKKLITSTETPKRSQDEVIVNTAKETKVPEPEPEDDKKGKITVSLLGECY